MFIQTKENSTHSVYAIEGGICNIYEDMSRFRAHRPSSKKSLGFSGRNEVNLHIGVSEGMPTPQDIFEKYVATVVPEDKVSRYV